MRPDNIKNSMIKTEPLTEAELRQAKFQTQIGKALTVMAMYEWLGGSEAGKHELKQIDTYNMNIFALRDDSKENELVSVLMICLAKRGILGEVRDLEVEALTRFIQII